MNLQHTRNEQQKQQMNAVPGDGQPAGRSFGTVCAAPIRRGVRVLADALRTRGLGRDLADEQGAVTAEYAVVIMGSVS